MSDEQQIPDAMHEEASTAAHPQIGMALRSAREARGESVAEVAAALKLAGRQVVAMEEERLDELPGPAFVKGFFRNYGRYLGVDVEPMIAARWAEPARGVDLSPVTNAQGIMPAAGGGSGVGRAAVVLSAVLLVVIALGWHFDGFRLQGDETVELQSDVGDAPHAAESEEGEQPMLPDMGESDDAIGEGEPVVDAAPAAPETGGSAPATEAPVAPPALSAPTPKPVASVPPAATERPDVVVADSQATKVAPPPPAVAAEPAAQAPAAAQTRIVGNGSSRLVFRLRGDAWLQVRDAADRTLYSGTSPAGTTRVVQGDPPFWVTVGNATSVALEFDGRSIDLTPHMHTAGVARLVVE